MIIKKDNSVVVIILNKNKILLDPPKPLEGFINILSDPQKNLNTNKFFNMPGEYEVEGVYLRIYFNKKNLISVFRINEVNFIYLNEDLSDELLNFILTEWSELDIALIRNKINILDKIKNKLKFKMIIDLDNKNNLKGEKIKELKINSKKIEEKNIILV
ncbi:MAG: hypothetical protein KatS3mg094_542 [Candidatus Parcubacteria bacterium]|nr:MAG: hypothetical protein KatS3mg094_542 [Candidatus Parcubacteria bacterium]